MRVLRYTIKRALAKLNIKHRMSCNKPTAYKMLTKFFLDIFAMLYGKEVTLIYWGIGCAIPEHKNFGVYFYLVINFLVRLSWNTKLYFIFKVWKGVFVLNGNWNRFLIFLC